MQPQYIVSVLGKVVRKYQDCVIIFYGRRVYYFNTRLLIYIYSVDNVSLVFETRHDDVGRAVVLNSAVADIDELKPQNEPFAEALKDLSPSGLRAVSGFFSTCVPFSDL